MAIDGGAETMIGIKSTALRKNNIGGVHSTIGMPGTKRSKDS